MESQVIVYIVIVNKNLWWKDIKGFCVERIQILEVYLQKEFKWE